MKSVIISPRFFIWSILAGLILCCCESGKYPLDSNPLRQQAVVQIISPLNNTAVSGTISIHFTINHLEADSLAEVELYIGDSCSGCRAPAAADSLEWNTSSCEDGAEVALRLKLFSDSLLSAVSNTVLVVVNNQKLPFTSELDSISCTDNIFNITWSRNTSLDFKSYSLYESLRPDFYDSSLIDYSEDIDHTSFSVSGIAADECRFYKLVVSDSSGLTAAGPVKPASATGQNGYLLYYLKIWRELFLSRNGISQDYYDAHVEIVSGGIMAWYSGISFKLYYRLQIDWAQIDGYDQFQIMLYSTEPAYQRLNIRRDVYLTRDEITAVLDHRVFNSSIGQVNPVEQLLYPSYDQAVAAFQTAVNCDKIFPQQTAYYVPGKLPHIDGDPYFLGFGKLDSLNNRCIDGYFNLLNGSGEAHETVCIIIN